MDSIIEKRKQNWVDFYDLCSPVNRLLVVDYTKDFPQPPPLWWEKQKEREEWAYLRYMMQLENMEKLCDNTVPYLSMITGTEIFAEAFGCKVHKPDNNTPFALPLIKNVSEWYKIKVPKYEDTKLVNLFEMADHLKARAGKDALLSLPDIQTPVDVAALIWEKSDFYASMFEEEEAVKELSCMIKEFMFSFLDEWFRRYGKEHIAHYPEYYMPYGITISEDEIGIVSSDMYKEYFREELHEFAAHYGAIGIHCCAASDHQWDNLKEVPNLKVLNFVRNEEDTKKAVKFFGDVTAQYHTTMVDISDLPNAGRIHLANYVYTDTFESALSIADTYNRSLV